MKSEECECCGCTPCDCSWGTDETQEEKNQVILMIIFNIGDLVYDEDLGVGIITQIMQDGYEDGDGYYVGIVYLVWWSNLGDTAIEFPAELTPYWVFESRENKK